jgi:site-specific DNA-methyltransferase (adenine-specific)
MNSLYFGDNLEVMRESIKDESVDLVYLDPPFNSKRDYNLLFKSPEGAESNAQITAFEDSWHWGVQAVHEYNEVVQGTNTNVAELLIALKGFLGTNDMMAYIVMMANRLVELHRVLKPTGSLFLHCDPTASHYLKLVLDGVFGNSNFRNELIWNYGGWTHQQMNHFPRKHDVILYYGKSDEAQFRPVSLPWTREDYIAKRKQKIHVDTDGREYIFDERGGAGQKRFLDVALAEGQPVTSVWDISPLTSSSGKFWGPSVEVMYGHWIRLSARGARPSWCLGRGVLPSSNRLDKVRAPSLGSSLPHVFRSGSGLRPPPSSPRSWPDARRCGSPLPPCGKVPWKPPHCAP